MVESANRNSVISTAPALTTTGGYPIMADEHAIKHSVNFKDLAGMHFGRLVVKAVTAIRRGGEACWLCLCECGNEKVARGGLLTRGLTRSCGCMRFGRKNPASRDRIKNIAGQRFARLTAVEFFDTERGARWACICDCGNNVVVRASSLKAGVTRSCGCRRADVNLQLNTTHGLSKTRENLIWRKAKDRCFNPKNSHYAYYGGRGITMAKCWADSFERFLADMGPCSPGLTLDRIDNDGPYTGPCAEYPTGNCRWTTRKVQMNNRRISKKS